MLLISLITQSTWIACLLGFTCNRSSPTEPASENGSKSERARCKKYVGNIARSHCFRFCSADITPTVYWMDYRKVNFVSLFTGRGKLIKLLKVKSETERKLGQVRYLLKTRALYPKTCHQWQLAIQWQLHGNSSGLAMKKCWHGSCHWMLKGINTALLLLELCTLFKPSGSKLVRIMHASGSQPTMHTSFIDSQPLWFFFPGQKGATVEVLLSRFLVDLLTLLRHRLQIEVAERPVEDAPGAAVGALLSPLQEHLGGLLLWVLVALLDGFDVALEGLVVPHEARHLDPVVWDERGDVVELDLGDLPGVGAAEALLVGRLVRTGHCLEWSQDENTQKQDFKSMAWLKCSAFPTLDLTVPFKTN